MIADLKDAIEQLQDANELSHRGDREFDEPDAGFNRAAVEFNGADLQGDVENDDSDWPSEHLDRIATRVEAAKARCYLARDQVNSTFVNIHKGERLYEQDS